jgi:hypothetical protein
LFSDKYYLALRISSAKKTQLIVLRNPFRQAGVPLSTTPTENHTKGMEKDYNLYPSLSELS